MEVEREREGRRGRNRERDRERGERDREKERGSKGERGECVCVYKGEEKRRGGGRYDKHGDIGRNKG